HLPPASACVYPSVCYLVLFLSLMRWPSFLFFFFTGAAPTEFSTLSLHDALPISVRASCRASCPSRFSSSATFAGVAELLKREGQDRKSTRLNSSHVAISYAVFCLKKKKKRTSVMQYKTHTHHKQREIRQQTAAAH